MRRVFDLFPRATTFLATESHSVFYWWPVCLGIGIYAFFILDQDPTWWRPPIALMVIGALSFWCLRPEVRLIFFAILAAVIGFGSAVIRSETLGTQMLQTPLRTATIDGRIKNAALRPTGLRLIIKIMAAPPSHAIVYGQNAQVFVRDQSYIPSVGEVVRLQARLRPVPAPVAPGAYDPQRHAYFQGISAHGFAFGSIETLSPGNAGFVARTIDTARRAIRTAVLTSGRDPPSGVALALIIGERGIIPLETMEHIRSAGIAHLLAISGLHIGLVAGLFFALTRLLIAAIPWLALRTDGKKIACVVAWPPTLAYALIAGFTIPTERAFIMTTIVLAGVFFDRRAITLRSVAIAATLILTFRPESLLQPGFQMSFAAVTALVTAYEWWRKRRPDLGVRSGWWAQTRRYVLGVIFTSIIAGTATAPFVLYHFQHVAAYGLLGNLFAIPLAAFWVMPTGVLVAATIPFDLYHAPLWVMKHGISLMLIGAEWVAGLPGSSHNPAAPPQWAIIVIAVSGLWLCLWTSALRALALPFLIFGGWGLGQAAPPDLLIHEKGDLIAIHSGAGQVWTNTPRQNTYVAKRWQQRLGATALSEPMVNGFYLSENLRCDARGCVFKRNNRTASIVFSPAFLDEDCRRNDFVAATFPIRIACESAHTDRFDLWRYGTHAIRLTPDAVIVESVHGYRGQRAWVVRPAMQTPQ